MNTKLLTFLSLFMLSFMAFASKPVELHGDIYHPYISEYRADTEILNVPNLFVFDHYSRPHVQLRYVPGSNPIALDVILVEDECHDESLRVLNIRGCEPLLNNDRDFDFLRGSYYDPLLDIAYVIFLYNGDLYRAALYADPNQVEGAKKRMLVHSVKFWKNYED